MKTVLIDIADFLTVVAIAALFLYLRFKNLESNAKDLGDGGIQTLFGNKNSKYPTTQNPPAGFAAPGFAS